MTDVLPSLPEWIARQLPQGGTRNLVDVGGHRMHVMEWGAGPPVLLVHGNPTWGFLYRKVVAALRGEPLRLIVPDLIERHAIATCRVHYRAVCNDQT